MLTNSLRIRCTDRGFNRINYLYNHNPSLNKFKSNINFNSHAVKGDLRNHKQVYVLKQSDKSLYLIGGLVAGLVFYLFRNSKSSVEAEMKHQNVIVSIGDDEEELIDDKAYAKMLESNYRNEYKLDVIERRSLKNISNGAVLIAFHEEQELNLFSKREVIHLAEVANHYAVVFIRLDSGSANGPLNQIAENVDEIARKGVLKTLVIVAHGDESSIQLTRDRRIEINESLPGGINCSHDLEYLLNKIPLEANLVLNCCSTGKGEKSIAYRIAQLAGGRFVYAPTRTCYGFPQLDLESGKIAPKFHVSSRSYESKSFVKKSGSWEELGAQP